MEPSPFVALRRLIGELEAADIEYRDWDAFLLGATDIVRTQQIRAAEGYAREARRWQHGRYLGIPEAITDAILFRGWEDQVTATTLMRPFARAFVGMDLRKFSTLDADAVDGILVANGAPSPEVNIANHRVRLRAWGTVLAVCRQFLPTGWTRSGDVASALQAADGAFAVQSMLAPTLGFDSRCYRSALRNFGASLAPDRYAALRALSQTGWLSAGTDPGGYQAAVHRAAAQLGRNPIALTWLLAEGSLCRTQRLRLEVRDERPLRRAPKLALAWARGQADGQPQDVPPAPRLAIGSASLATAVAPAADGSLLLRDADRRRPIADLVRDLLLRPGTTLEFAATSPRDWEMVRVISRGAWPASSIPRPHADW